LIEMGVECRQRAQALAAIPIVNPVASALGKRNAVPTGTGRRYCAPDCEGWLSIKTVVSGSAAWEAGGRRFVLHENNYLILNDRQHYTITIESPQKVTTFCIFFERGFVEDVFRGLIRPDGELLEAPQVESASPLGFREKIESEPSRLLSKIRAIQRAISAPDSIEEEIEDRFRAIAEAMVREHQHADSARAKLSPVRAATREELYKRLLRGRDCLLSSQSQPVRLLEAARAACLSPYHFHRTFTRAFGETPHAFLTRQRLARAAHLLTHTGHSVTEICLETGFESLGSFSTLFRRRFGASPREFRLSRAHK
jgi:AraC family transcriptional regulator